MDKGYWVGPKLSIAIVVVLLGVQSVHAATTAFFSSSQVATLVSSDVTSDTISSNGYQFTYTLDKLFTGGTGQIIGRQELVTWPDGIHAQAVSTPPAGVTDHKARIEITRVDGDVFDLTSITIMLLANTAGAGGAVEIMPLIDGEDGLNDPVAFDVSGYAWVSFSYDESPNPWGSTALLKGFDTYKMSLYADFALTAITFEGAAVVEPAIPGDLDGDGFVGLSDLDIVLVNWNQNVAAGDLMLGDATGDGFVGLADLDVVLNNWNAGTPAVAGGVVPEPGSVGLLLLGVVGLMRRGGV